MLHLNDTNEVVPQVQEALMGLHYMDADEPTDFYGQQTEYAIQLFQRGNGLMVDGVAGYETLTLLFSGEAEQYLVHKGDKGWDIKQVQKRLKELGYLTGGYTDERYDDATYSAIREFQGRNKLSQDGVIGHNTLQTLFNGDAEPARSYKPPASDGGTTSDGGGGGDSSNISYDANSASDFVAFAKSIMNKGYTYLLGGKSPPSMDCSGFVYYCLNQTGNNINYRTSAAWAKSSHDTISSIHDAKPGDILCFEGHVAICIGGGKMIDSSSSQNAIRITNYESSSYWNKKWICAKRVFD
jgi:peptidoglycan hydrolase-like protein with peptidoglycan-binding domain